MNLQNLEASKGHQSLQRWDHRFPGKILHIPKDWNKEEAFLVE